MSINRFAVNSSHIYDITKASIVDDGLMSSSDKIKLDGLVNSSLGANVEVTVISPSTEELTKELSDIKNQLSEQRNLYNSVENFINSPGKPDGLATLDSNGKLSSDQLPAFKTVNNQSIIGSGNIEIRPGTDVDFTPVTNMIFQNTSLIENLSTNISENYATTQYVDEAVSGIVIPDPYDDTVLRTDISNNYALKSDLSKIDVTEQLKDYALKSELHEEYNDELIQKRVDDVSSSVITVNNTIQSHITSSNSSISQLKNDVSRLFDANYLTEDNLVLINAKSLVGNNNYTLADFSDNIVSDSNGTGIQFKNRFIFGETNIGSMRYEDSSQRFVFDKPVEYPGQLLVQSVTQAQYDALTEKDSKTLYIITD